jgi:pyruvate/oxaloacetate carboxyltransferase
MAIQQQINSLLGMGTIAAGLYTQSPAGKKAELKRSIKQGEESFQKAQIGYQKAEKTPEEAEQLASSILEGNIEKKKRLAEMTGDISVYEDIAYDEQYLDYIRNPEETQKLTGKERSIAEGQQQVKQFMDNQIFMEELRARAEKAGFG